MEGLGRQGWGSEHLRLARALVSYIVIHLGESRKPVVDLEQSSDSTQPCYSASTLFVRLYKRLYQRLTSRYFTHFTRARFQQERPCSSPLEKSFSRPPEVCKKGKKGHRSVRINCDDEGFADGPKLELFDLPSPRTRVTFLRQATTIQSTPQTPTS